MPTVGNTAKPASSQEWFGVNAVNQMGQLIAMPAGGPWVITRLGAWLAGQGGGATVALCAWDSSGNLLAASNAFTAAGLAFALGNSTKYETGAFTPFQVAGGQQIYVGFWRHSDHPVQNGRYSSGGHLHDTVGDSPEGLYGAAADGSGGIGAYVADYQVANQAPTAPTLTQSGTQHNGRTVLLSWVHHDPDGNPQNNAQVELRWDGNPGATIDSWYMSDYGGQFNQAVWRTLPAGYNADTLYSYRVRTADTVAWGPWSGWQQFRPNTGPNKPWVNAIPNNTLTPTISGGVSDNDGNSMTAGNVEVVNEFTGGTMWGPGNPGDLGVTPNFGQWDTVYAGLALSWGSTYRFRIQMQDEHGGLSAWSDWVYWTPVQPTGPTLTPNTTAVKQDTLTPDLTITYGSNFTDHELEVVAPGGAVVFTDAPAPYAATGSKIVVPSGLSWGQQYEYRARVFVGGAWTAWSQYALFKTNAEPTAPTLSMPESTLSPSGERVVTTLTPILRAVFNDADRVPYGDTPTAASLEVRDNATDALVATLTDITEDTVYDGAALAWMTTYKWRKRYTDDAGRQGPFSDYQTFRPARAPEAALTAPAEDAVVTESTPALDWAFSSVDGKSQYSHRVLVKDRGPTGQPFWGDRELVHEDDFSAAQAEGLPAPDVGVAYTTSDRSFADRAASWFNKGWWRLASAADSSGNGFTLTPIGGVTAGTAASLLTGDADAATQIDGVDDLFVGPDVGITGAHSGFIRFKRLGNPNGSGSNSWHTMIRAPDGNPTTHLLVNPAGTDLYFQAFDAGGVLRARQVSGLVLGDGLPHSLGYSYDGSAFQLYADGLPVGAPAPCVGLLGGDQGVRIGASAAGTWEANAVLDEAGLGSTVFTAAQHLELHALASRGATIRAEGGMAVIGLPDGSTQSIGTNVSIRDTLAEWTFSLEKQPTGVESSLFARSRLGSTDYYSLQINVNTTGTIGAGLIRRKDAGVQVVVVPVTLVPGLTWASGRRFGCRFETIGINPTVVRFKIWDAAAAEPAAWTFEFEDPDDVEPAGDFTFLGWARTSATNLPNRIDIDNLLVEEALNTEVVVHDSGERVTDATEYTVPFGVLEDDHDYRWEVTVKDTDGLTDVLA